MSYPARAEGLVNMITFTFRLIPLEKAWTLLSLYVGLQHHSEWVQTPVGLLHSLSDARGVMVIVVGNEHGDTSSNARQDWLHFT